MGGWEWWHGNKKWLRCYRICVREGSWASLSGKKGRKKGVGVVASSSSTCCVAYCRIISYRSCINIHFSLLYVTIHLAWFVLAAPVKDSFLFLSFLPNQWRTFCTTPKGHTSITPTFPCLLKICHHRMPIPRLLNNQDLVKFCSLQLVFFNSFLSNFISTILN